MGRIIMIQGTMSGVGKSIITAGLCRLLTNSGYKVLPFKSQNMSNFYYETKSGHYMSKAQAIQAQACHAIPDPLMNPLLLMPTGERKSKVYLKGSFLGEYSAKEYYELRKDLIPEVLSCARELIDKSDYLIIEGAGGCAEINLREDDVVNMGLARMLNAPVYIVGDIEPGGVFAQLYGSYMLMEEDDKTLINGFIINKFRGDIEILEPGIRLLEEKTDIPVIGTIPWTDIDIEDEDSYSLGKNQTPVTSQKNKATDDITNSIDHVIKNQPTQGSISSTFMKLSTHNGKNIESSVIKTRDIQSINHSSQISSFLENQGLDSSLDRLSQHLKANLRAFW